MVFRAAGGLRWLEGYRVCKGGTHPAQLKYKTLAHMACEKITRGITHAFIGKHPVKALLDPYNPQPQRVRCPRWERLEESGQPVSASAGPPFPD
jgi:hypothetical protein